jgi:hypothetical protein
MLSTEPHISGGVMQVNNDVYWIVAGLALITLLVVVRLLRHIRMKRGHKLMIRLYGKDWR